MVLTAHESINDASSVLHFRSALRHTTDSSFTIFSYTLNTMAFDHSTYKCFAISTCMAIAEGLPPSQKEHCLDFYLKVVAFRTHYVINYYCPRWTASYSVSIGLRHLYQHIIGGFFITPCNASAYTIRPSIAGGFVFQFIYDFYLSHKVTSSLFLLFYFLLFPYDAGSSATIESIPSLA